jgi:hypothetical protein
VAEDEVEWSNDERPTTANDRSPARHGGGRDGVLRGSYLVLGICEVKTFLKIVFSTLIDQSCNKNHTHIFYYFFFALNIYTKIFPNVKVYTNTKIKINKH